MSTVFDVFPTADRIRTFNELLRLASDHLNSLLSTSGIIKIVSLEVGLRDDQDHVLAIDLNGPCWWDEGRYAWFYIPGVPGGTDAHTNLRSEERLDILQPRDASMASLVEKSRRVGRHWSFRRSMGQPALINIAYGMLAGSLAQITDGLVDSIDCAWDSSLLPARSSEFFEWFMRPDANSDPSWQNWSELNHEWAADDVRNF